jgi:Spy/CpxP family protein refolding chaperone
MKKIFLFAICLVFAIATQAQSNTDEVSLIQSAYGMGKQQLINDFMKIPEAQSAEFWKIYDEYEVARKEIGKKRAENIMLYADSYLSLTNDAANKLIKNSLAINNASTKLWNKTYSKMSKAITPVKAAQFIQIEMYLENMVRSELASQIPVIGEFDKN